MEIFSRKINSAYCSLVVFFFSDAVVCQAVTKVAYTTD